MHMYSYIYAKSRRQGLPYHNQISAFPLSLQHQMPIFNQTNGHGSPAGLANFTGLGYPASWGPFNQTGFGAQGQMASWGGPVDPTVWGSYGNPVGWGRPGMFDGLLKVGKGAMGGLGILTNLISIGKFFY